VKILIANNFVRFGSGVDGVVRLERETLLSRNHEVAVFERDNYDFDRADGARRASLLTSCLYSFPVRRELTSILRRATRSATGPYDVVHVHNTVPLMTGSIWDACREAGVPTVQHLHNYRAFCLSSYSFRDEHACDSCSATAFAACAVHGCYRDSRLLSSGLLAARMIDWSHGRRSGYGADTFIACSEWVKRRHVEHGLPADRIEVVRNSANDLAEPLGGPQTASLHGRCAPLQKRLAFVGSLLKAKGVYRVIDLAEALPEFEFRLLGTGAEQDALAREIDRRNLGNVILDGLKRSPDMQRVWAPSFATLMPSAWEDPFPLVAPESLSLGVPVVTTGTGGLSEAVDDGATGIIDDFRNPRDLAAIVRALWADGPRHEAMFAAARRSYEVRHTRPVFAQALEGALERLCEPARTMSSRPRVAVSRPVSGPPAHARLMSRPSLQTTALRVLIDGHMLGTRETGNETYVRGLIEGLSHTKLIHTVAVRAETTTDLGSTPTLPLTAGSSNLSRLLFGLPALAKRCEATVVHGTYVVPPATACARVVTIHDVSFSRHPDMFTARDRTVLGLGIRMSARIAERIIVPSKHARDEVLDLINVPEERIVVTPEGVSTRYRPHTTRETAPVLARHGLDRPYVLAVGNLEPRKNLGRLLEAWPVAASQWPDRDVVLALVGSQHGLGEDVRLAAERLGIQRSVITTGWVGDEDLPALYAGAQGFVYPSLYEGFGLPVLEAMASGTPVACSSASSIPEVAGEAALLFNPYDIDEIAQALVTIIGDDDVRTRLVADGYARSRQFTWQKCAAATLAVYGEALAERIGGQHGPETRPWRRSS
jgi:glycosyltransferase involved in cell wall biosynthesis